MISIIVPVYNAAQWLPQCIESCLNQSFKDIELILVNDASKDNSLSVCQKYQTKDPRVKIIHKIINEGSEQARISGYKNAQGNYIMYIDADDWLSNPHVLSHMYRKAEDTNADYVEIGVQRVMDKHAWIKRKGISPVSGLIESPELFEKYYLSFFGVNILSVTMWGKLYRKSTLEKVEIKPMGIAMGEDLIYNVQLFPHLKRIYIINEVGYNYRFGGMTSKYNARLLPDLKRIFQIKNELIKKYNYQKAFDYIRIELKNILLSDICQRIYFLKNSRKELIEGISLELEDPIYQHIMEIKGNPQLLNTPIIKAIQAKDAETLYELMNNKVKKERFSKSVKRIISYIFTHI
mgnify:CR=1 FL=1